MKILLSTNSFENIVNGPAKFANLLLEINDLYPAHEVRVLTEDISFSRLGNLQPYVYQLKLEYPNSLKLFSQFFRMFAYHRQAIVIREEFPFDILLYNHAMLSLKSASTNTKGFKVVGMLNDDNNLTKTWKVQGSLYSWLKHFMFKFFEREAVKRLYIVITNSNFLTKSLQLTYHPKIEKLQRLYKSVSVQNIEYRPERKNNNNIIRILFVKADFKRGGIEELIQATKLLSSFNFHLTIIGPEEKFKITIENWAASINNLQINFKGPQSQKTVFENFYTHDIFCVPSRKEALGVANMEAAIHGIPIVYTNVGGIPEVMNYGENGWEAEANNSTSLAKAINNCITEEQERKIKQTAANRFIRNQFNEKVMFKNFLSILESSQSAT
jgi:colanic acid/amylovoran biosynthesis glycosyltransferase